MLSYLYFIISVGYGTNEELYRIKTPCRNYNCESSKSYKVYAKCEDIHFKRSKPKNIRRKYSLICSPHRYYPNQSSIYISFD